MKKYRRLVGRSGLSLSFTESFFSLFRDSRGHFIDYRLKALYSMCALAYGEFKHAVVTDASMAGLCLPLSAFDSSKPDISLLVTLDLARFILIQLGITSITLYTDGQIIATRSSLKLY